MRVRFLIDTNGSGEDHRASPTPSSNSDLQQQTEHKPSQRQTETSEQPETMAEQLVSPFLAASHVVSFQRQLLITKSAH